MPAGSEVEVMEERESSSDEDVVLIPFLDFDIRGERLVEKLVERRKERQRRRGETRGKEKKTEKGSDKQRERSRDGEKKNGAARWSLKRSLDNWYSKFDIEYLKRNRLLKQYPYIKSRMVRNYEP